MSAESQSDSGREPRQATLWRRVRRLFRWTRIVILTVLLFGAAVLLWCNYVRVPAPITSLITAQLRERRINVEFSHLRLRGFRQVTARDLRFSHSASNDFPRFEAQSADLLLDSGKLRRGEIEIAGLRLEQGRLSIPIHATNEAPRFLTVSNVATEIDFLPGDAIRVNSVTMEALGAKAYAAGMLRNLGTYKPPRARAGGGGWQHWKRELREIHDLAETLQFTEPPVISLRLSADASDLSGMRGAVSIHAGPARSEWASFERLRIVSGIFNARTNTDVAARFQLEVAELRTLWGSLSGGQVQAETVWSAHMDRLITNSLSLSLAEAESSWGRFENATASVGSWHEPNGPGLRSKLSITTAPVEGRTYALGASELQAVVHHSLPFPSPAAWFRRLLHGTAPGAIDANFSGEWGFRASNSGFARASFDTLQLSGKIEHRPPAEPDSSAGPGFLRHTRIPWQLTVSNVLSEQIAVGTLESAGEWEWPRLSLTQLDARLYDGRMRGSAEIDLRSGQANASAEGGFDFKRVAQLLDRPVQRWLEQFSWTVPPFVQLNAAFRLPPWTNSWEEVEKTFLANLRMNGWLKGSGSFRGIPIQNAEGQFQFSDFVWHLPGLALTQSEGTTRLEYSGNVTNGNFSLQIDSQLDPGVLRSLLPEQERKGFDLVKFPYPPRLTGQARGNWDRKEEIIFKGQFAATNFLVRGKEVSEVAGDLSYSNLVIECWNVQARLGTGTVRAPFLRIDIPGEVMLVTNAISTADPYLAMSMVGPESYQAIDPYRFAVPPTVRINGLVPLRRVSKADLWFDVAGHEFSFWKFHIPHLAGQVHWRGDELWITNVAASFYNGRSAFNGYFLIHDRKAEQEDYADFQFSGTATNADLRLLVADLFGRTNHMEGILSGHLVVTSANSANTNSWNGYGQAVLSDGFLWNVPVFGVFTPVLDAAVPGASMSRVTSGQGNFSITNSVVHTRDLQVRTKAFRLNYDGSVDLRGKLDALVEAEIFRDAWLVGKVFSVVLWPISKAFEARISGTVAEPKTELRFFPRFLFAPIKTLNQLAAPQDSKKPPPEPARR